MRKLIATDLDGTILFNRRVGAEDLAAMDRWRAAGYNEREALAAMKQLPAETGTSDGIRQALKLLSKV